MCLTSSLQKPIFYRFQDVSKKLDRVICTVDFESDVRLTVRTIKTTFLRPFSPKTLFSGCKNAQKRTFQLKLASFGAARRSKKASDFVLNLFLNF